MGRKAFHVLGLGLLLVMGVDAAVIGCSSFSGTPTETDAGQVEGGGPNDGAQVDVGATMDATDAMDAMDASPACTNLLLNGNFEFAQPTCAPWTNSGGGLAVPASPARSGATACRACANAGTLPRINLITNLTGKTFAPGEVVHFEAWVRAAEGGGLFAKSGSLFLLMNGNSARSTPFLLSDVYERIAVDYVVLEDGGASQTPSFQFLVNAPSDGGGDCMLLDDITVCRDGG